MVCILFELFDNQYSFQMYRSQVLAEDIIKLKSIPIKKCCCFCQDIMTNSGQKRFGIIPLVDIQTITKLSGLLSEDHHIYEWLVLERPVKPYFDCEMEIKGLTLNDSFKLILRFIRILLREMNLIFDLHINENELIILDSCKIGKLSYHIIVNSTVYFENTLQHKIFITWFISRFIFLQGITEYTDDITALTWNKIGIDNKPEQRFIFDDRAYITGQKFRCINQSKMGSNRPLKSMKPVGDYTETGFNKLIPYIYTLDNLTDSLVGIYEEIPPHFRLLNVEPLNLKEAMVKKNRIKNHIKPTETSQMTPICDNDGYVISGSSLMTDYDELQTFPAIKQYLYLIPNNPSQPYDIFNKIRFFYFHNGGNRNDFEKWWRLSPTFDNDKTQLKIFDTIPDPITNNNKYLKNCVFKSQPAFFFTQSPLLDAYYNPVYDTTTEIINESSNYVSEAGTQYEDDIHTSHDFLLLDADMGSGKSVAIQRLIPKYKTVLILTPRITYTKHVATEFRVDSYLDGVYDGDKIACSIESLHKLPKNKVYDLVVMDECEAVLSIFSSPTLYKNEIETFKILNNIINTATKIIFAGAFITQKTINYISSFENKTLRVIKHTRTNVPKKYAVQVESLIFDTLLIDYIKKGGKPYVFFDSKTRADKFISILEGEAKKDLFMADILKRMIFYSSKADDANLDLLDNINETWSNASFVIATPSITVGNSYCPPQTTFTSVWIYFFPSCIVADTMQGHKRVRYTTTNTLYYCVPRDKLLNFISGGRGSFIKSMTEYDHITQDKRIMAGTYAIQQRDEITKKLLLTAKTQVEWCKRHKNKPVLFDKIVDALSVKYIQTPEPLRKLLLNNANESVLSCVYFKSMVSKFISRCGYDKITRTMGNRNNNEQIQVELEKNAIPEDNDYLQITTITEDEYDILQSEIKRKKCSFIQKQQVEKYCFDKHINPDLPDKMKQWYFKLFIDNKTNHILKNLFKEATRTGNDVFLQNIEPKRTKHNKTETLAMMEQNKITNSLRLGEIRNLLNMLGLQNSLDNTTITSEHMLTTSKYIQTNRKLLHSIFNITDRCIKQQYNIETLGLAFLQKIITLWNGCVLEKNISKDKITTYTLQSKMRENPPYQFNLTVKEESLNEPLPMTGLNENILLSFNECLNYEIEKIKQEPFIIPENSIIHYLNQNNDDLVYPTKTDLHRMGHVKRGTFKPYYTLRPDLHYTFKQCFLCR